MGTPLNMNTMSQKCTSVKKKKNNKKKRNHAGISDMQETS